MRPDEDLVYVPCSEMTYEDVVIWAGGSDKEHISKLSMIYTDIYAKQNIKIQCIDTLQNMVSVGVEVVPLLRRHTAGIYERYQNVIHKVI